MQANPRPYDPFTFTTTAHPPYNSREHTLSVPHQHTSWDHKVSQQSIPTSQSPRTEHVALPLLKPKACELSSAFPLQCHRPNPLWEDQSCSNPWPGCKVPSASSWFSQTWPYAYPPPPPPALHEHSSTKCMSPLAQEIAASTASGSSDSKQAKILWLSEEESELIRQLRQHGVKVEGSTPFLPQGSIYIFVYDHSQLF